MSLDLELEERVDTIVIIQQQELQEKLQKFLQNIFGAVKKNVGEDVYLLALEKGHSQHLGDVLQHNGLSSFVFFGVQPKDVGFQGQFQTNRVSRYGNLQVIVAPNLDRLQSDVAAKKLLWAQLQQCFRR